MATTTTNTIAPMGAITILHLIDYGYELAQRVVSWNDARQTRKILMSLSQEQLEDTGLTRNGRG
jgi:uncharacterized protein YjiS (DUF1127 family)